MLPLLAVTAVLTPVLAVQSPAAAAGRVVTRIGTAEVEASFTTPPAGGRDRTILSDIVRLVDGTPSGETIRMAIYSITVRPVYDAIARAKARGVTVQVVHNGEDRKAENSTPRDLAALLGADHHWCDHGRADLSLGGGCLSTDPSGLMHSKYMLFSRTRDAAGALRSDVVWFGSANETYASGSDTFNNTVTVYGDRTLYTGFTDGLWTPMWQERRYAADDFYDASAGRGYFGSTVANTHAYASPEQQTDIAANRLSFIEPGPGCRVRAMQASVNDTRPEVVDELIRVKRGGCGVWVAAESVGPTALRRLRAAGIPVRKNAIHDKAFVTLSRYAGSTELRPIVFTGSENISASALRRNDELFVKVNDSRPLYEGFRQHFLDAYDSGRPF